MWVGQGGAGRSGVEEMIKTCFVLHFGDYDTSTHM